MHADFFLLLQVWVLFCATSSFVSSLEVFTGADAAVDGTAQGVIGRLLGEPSGTNFGSVLYTDNFYTYNTLPEVSSVPNY